ncbi:hypothetical protein SCUCBS95973_002506 [Sporothrix curviconia]|uniref:RING-type domain-containing protein n=1 Tax=Sporothrix curviconia TaxID=1260050 RepID=A0ABP0B7J8_9PEZI
MPFIDHMLEGAALLARQATTSAAAALTSAATTTGTIASAPTTGVSGTGISGAATTTNPPPSGTSAAPPSATTTSGGNGGGGGGSSPLLFFVALGFGVVFTNLWIIVGVKYCFRYNARARQLRLAAEDGEPINLENMPHPRRRRREKKLMTIDEVNEKFPMVKYKTWVATRAEEGLPTAGGVNAPSRPNSVRSVEGAIAPLDEELTSRDRRASTEEPEDVNDKERPATSIAEVDVSHAAVVDSGAASTSAPPESPRREETSTNADIRGSIASADDDTGLGVYNKTAVDGHFNHSDDEDDEHIDSALPPECVGTSGDTCAICIDTLEDDDDVRGLTCGHAFHAVCLDPWLTSRRACCPLCKADYYTPKPRPPPGEGIDAAAAQAAAMANDRNRMNMPSRPGTSWRPVRMLPGRFILGPRNANAQDPAVVFSQVEVQDMSADAAAPPAVSGAPEVPAQPQVAQPAATRSNWIGNLRPFRRRNGESSQQTEQTDTAPAASEVSPSQLEAGIRPS